MHFKVASACVRKTMDHIDIHKQIARLKIGDFTFTAFFQALHINVGCPPAKRIVIRNCTEASDEDPLPLLSQVQQKQVTLLLECILP